MLFVASCNGSQSEPPQSLRGCVPSYLLVADSPLATSGESAWLFTFSVALVGCTDDLERVEPDALESIKAELIHPAKWTLIDMVANHQDDAFRSTVAERVNEILGARAVSDVLFFSVGYVDHNVALDRPEN